MNDLYLKFQFTDRAGRRVYNIYEADTNIVQPEKHGSQLLGQVRMHPFAKDDNVLLEWVQDD